MLRFIGWTLLILLILVYGLPLLFGIVGGVFTLANGVLSAALGVFGVQHPIFSTHRIGHMAHGVFPFRFHFGLIETLILIGVVVLVVRLVSGKRRSAAGVAGPAPTVISDERAGYERVSSRAHKSTERLQNAERRAFGETTEAERVRELEKGFERLTERLESLETILLEERERRRD